MLIIAVLRSFLNALTREKPEEQLPFNVEDHAEPNPIVKDLAIESAAIVRATEVINQKIDRGEIRTHDELRKAVLEEFSFQKIALHEEL